MNTGLRHGAFLVFALLGSVSRVFGGTGDGAVRAIGSLLRAHQYQQAAQMARQALQSSPGDARLLTMEGIAYSNLGGDREARLAFDGALRVSPDYIPALEGAAQLEYKAGSERAIPFLDRLLKLRPAGQTAHAMRAVMAWKHGDCATAVQHFGQSKSEIASQPEALREYGICLVKLKQPEQARSVFEQLAALDPGDRPARHALAAVDLMTGHNRSAIDTLQPMLTAESADADALGLASAAYEALGDTPNAVSALRRAIVAAPRNLKLYIDFASLCLTHKSFQVGVDMINAGLTQSPDAAQLYLARGVLYVQLGQYDSADADFLKAERLDPGRGAGSVARGMAKLQQNDAKKALKIVLLQLKTRPNDAFLHYLLAEILSSRGARPGSPEFQRAVDAASEAVRIDPGFVLARDVLSRLYLESGQAGLAIEQSRRALRDNPDDQIALYRLIRALQKSGRKQDAAEIPGLLKRFGEVRAQARKREAEESRYRLVEQAPPK